MSEVAITGLNFRTTVDDIYRAFSPFGELTSCRIILNERQESKGYGFVCYKNDWCAIAAIQAMNGFNMDGHQISVTRAKGRNENQQNEKRNLFNQSPQYSRRSPERDDRMGRRRQYYNAQF